MAAQIDGILFDLGETLLDYGRVDVSEVFREGARQAYEYLQGLGQPLPSVSSYCSRQLWAIRWRCAVSHILRRDFDSFDVLARLSRQMGQTLSDEQLQQLSWCFYEPLGQHGRVAEATIETLRAFRDDGLKVGIVSNTFISASILDRHLAELGLLELLEPRVYSSRVVWRKPDRRIFAEALTLAELRADRTIFVGDRLDADVRGANRMGMISVLRDVGRRRRLRWGCKPVHTIHQVCELREIVARYNDG